MEIQKLPGLSTLSKRLNILAQEVEGPVLADIGCDHGFVCIQALLNCKVQKAYACDLREGPLESARANVAQAGLSDRIFCRLRNGIEGLEDDVNQILIAGMGGTQIEQILAASPLPDRVSSLLLSPHKDTEHLRQWLCDHGFTIVRERMIQDGHFYPLLYVRPPKAEKQSPAVDGTLSPQALYFGVHPKRDADYDAWLLWRLNKWKTICKTMPEDKKAPFLQKIEMARSLQNLSDGSVSSTLDTEKE